MLNREADQISQQMQTIISQPEPNPPRIAGVAPDPLALEQQSLARSQAAYAEQTKNQTQKM